MYGFGVSGVITKRKISKCLIFLFFIELTRSQTIIFPKNSNFWSASCGQTFIHRNDQVVLNGKINTMGIWDSLENIQYEIKEQNENYRTMCILDVKICDMPWHSECICQPTDVENVFEVKINFTADVSISEATIRGKLTYTNYSVYSEEIKIPKIYDPDNAEPVLYITNKVANVSSCFVKTEESIAEIVLIVNKLDNVPCRSQIKDVKSKGSSFSETNVVTYSTALQSKQSSFQISYQICNLKKFERIIYCNIETDISDIVVRHSECTNVTYIQASILIMQFLIILLLLYTQRVHIVRELNDQRCCFKKKLKKKDSYIDQETIPMDITDNEMLQSRKNYSTARRFLLLLQHYRINTTERMASR
ncbi:uncharacterized protein LOC129922991 isoform X2 [Biomphalaria glabrata]|uniref:Uncharacterized protein LOC129922991 isoform X2 n=1 Tax=Biomphalaria glabrata TaxID=6526 RepID=A0A9W2YXX3_BIOGL|nr:uncharacterized protein LOC129922991 isoform X2 [Biomphalaria glabrata]